MNDGIYLDYNATTPCDPTVVEKMLPYFGNIFGNPSNGLHWQGRSTTKAIEEAREHVANLISAQPSEIIFTSGATESNNLAILGITGTSNTNSRRRIVTCAVEHKSVLLPCKKLENAGFDVVVVPVDGNGRVPLNAIQETITSDTLLVSIQIANNETGTIQPIREISDIAHSKGAIFHCDAAQAVGKMTIDVSAIRADLLSMSAHKFYGPKGIGALYIRGGTQSFPITPLFWGGGQERNLRPGTSNVPAIVGFGEVARLSLEQLSEDTCKMELLRDLLEKKLIEEVPGLRVNAKDISRLPNTSNLIFPKVEAELLLLNLPKVMLGTGSACSSGAIEPSHVLQAMGISRENAYSAVRISLGRFTTQDEILAATDMIIEAWQNLAA